MALPSPSTHPPCSSIVLPFPNVACLLCTPLPPCFLCLHISFCGAKTLPCFKKNSQRPQPDILRTAARAEWTNNNRNYGFRKYPSTAAGLLLHLNSKCVTTKTRAWSKYKHDGKPLIQRWAVHSSTTFSALASKPASQNYRWSVKLRQFCLEPTTGFRNILAAVLKSSMQKMYHGFKSSQTNDACRLRIKCLQQVAPNPILTVGIF